MAAPGSRLHGGSVSGASAACASVRGSAAAPVKDPSGALPIAPARMTPRPSSARRSSNPLPATASGKNFPLLERWPEVLMFASLLPVVGPLLLSIFPTAFPGGGNIAGWNTASMFLFAICWQRRHINDRLRHGLEPVCGVLVDCFIQCALITTRRMKNSHPAQYTDELGVLFDDMIRWAVCIVID